MARKKTARTPRKQGARKAAARSTGPKRKAATPRKARAKPSTPKAAAPKTGESGAMALLRAWSPSRYTH